MLDSQLDCTKCIIELRTNAEKNPIAMGCFCRCLVLQESFYWLAKIETFGVKYVS